MIKFRGQRVYSGELVEGGIAYWESTVYITKPEIQEDKRVDWFFQIHPSTLQVMTTDGWADIADVEVVRKKKSCSHSCSPSDYKEGGKCDKMGCYKPEPT